MIYLQQKVLGVFLFVFVSIVLTSCGGMTLPKQLNCPPPPVYPCKAQINTSSPFDTSSIRKPNQEFHRTIKKVLNLSSTHTWQYVPISNNKGLLTHSDGPSFEFVNHAVSEAILDYVDEVKQLNLFDDNNVVLGTVSGTYSDLVVGVVDQSEHSRDVSLYSAEVNAQYSVILKNELVSLTPFQRWMAHPAVSPDGKTIVFAAETPNGIKGTDLYFTNKKSDGTWTDPINCGDVLNSNCDDICPSFSKNGKEILFSSYGHSGFGGYDIFSSNVSSTINIDGTKAFQFSQPINVGSPINTAKDELFPTTTTKSEETVYYSSNQENSQFFKLYVCYQKSFRPNSVATLDSKKITPIPRKSKTELQDSIKRVQEEKLLIENIDTVTMVTINGVVVNESTKEPIENADVTVTDKQKVVVAETKSDKQGNYTVTVPINKELEIKAEAENVFYDIKTIKITDSTQVPVLTFNVPIQLVLRINFPYDQWENPYEYVLDSNGNETNIPWQVAIEQVAVNLSKYPDEFESITIVGHTDDVASDSYNINLGKKRATFVRDQLLDYFKKNQLQPINILVKSEGERKLLPQRENEDVDIRRKRSRRVEFIKNNKNKKWKIVAPKR